MKHKIIFAACALALGASLLLAGVQLASGAARQTGAPAATQETPKVSVSADENKAYKKVEAATTPDARIKAAGEFLKKYPKTQIKQDVAALVAESIAGVPDQTQRIPLYESMIKTFDDPTVADRVYPVLLEAFTKANRLDDAYSAAAKWLEKNPNEVTWRTQLALTGVIEAQRKNPKYMQQSQQYAKQAIALMEADKKPVSFDDAQWQQFKAQWLPQLYQALGVVAYGTGNSSEAKANVEKAAALGITDPNTYLILGELADTEYERLAQQYKAMSPGAEQDATLKKALEQMDQAIELYAHAAALAEGKPDFQPLREEVMKRLTSYYQYRKGSTQGLQELINKYKKAPTQ